MAKSSSKSKQAQSAQYKSSNRCTTNHTRRLQQLIKLFPNDLNLKTALGNAGRKRSTPNAPQWSHRQKAIVKLFKEAQGVASRNLFHPDPKVQFSATQQADRNYLAQQLKSKAKVSFSLMARAHDQQGNPVWP